jgi:hypothetical protein
MPNPEGLQVPHSDLTVRSFGCQINDFLIERGGLFMELIPRNMESALWNEFHMSRPDPYTNSLSKREHAAASLEKEKSPLLPLIKGG